MGLDAKGALGPVGPFGALPGFSVLAVLEVVEDLVCSSVGESDEPLFIFLVVIGTLSKSN